MQEPDRNRRGSALLGKCDRAGYIELFTKAGVSVILPTSCHTWGCVVCRIKLLAMFRGKVEVGCSKLGRCSFITVTYQKDSERAKNAASVRGDFQALSRRIRKLQPNWEWIKVTELTKNQVPHHHLIIGPTDREFRCHGSQIRRGQETVRYRRRLPTCECMSHVFAREWWDITGDSYMCFGTEVEDPRKAGSYLGKYMEKDFGRPRKGRRYTTSRGWPGGSRMRLQRTQEGLDGTGPGWDYVRRWPGSKFTEYLDWNPEEKHLLLRVGDNVTQGIVLRGKQKKAAKLLERARKGQL